jgi:probable F420-dependent oxidoreductase
VAAGQTERIELITAIAIAFSRNPMNLANIGYDLQLQSGGRFILGLGSQIKPHIERRFSSVWSKPASRMRELVLAIRSIWACWQDGEKLDFNGEFYTHNLMTPVFNPGPNPHGLPAIFLAGVGPVMTEVVGEVADGYFVHPFHTREFLEDVTRPALERGLRKSGRSRDALQISNQIILATGENDEAIEQAMNGARAQLSFYGSTPAYRGVLESIDQGDLHQELHGLSKRGAWLEMAALISDDVVERIAVVAPRNQIAAKIRERCEGFADRVSLIAPFAPDPDDWADIVADLKAPG